MKKEVKKRFALLLSAIFAFTLIFNVMGANAETPAGSAYNTPTGNTYNAPADNKDDKTEGDKTNKVKIHYCYPAANIHGYSWGSDYFLLDKNNPNELLVDGKKFKPVGMTDGLDYSWVVDPDEHEAYVKTSNFQVNYYIENISKDLHDKLLQPQIVSAGTKITLPSTLEGKSVIWDTVSSFNGSEFAYGVIDHDVYTVNTNMSFRGLVVPDHKKPSEDTQQREIEQLKNYVDYGEKEYPATLFWDSYSYAGQTILPKEYLDVIKGHDINLKIYMLGGLYSWTINGKTIKDTSDIDLSVEYNDTVPDDAVASLAGSNDSRQMSLAHNGTFGFDAKLSVYVGGETKFANLFWYKPDGTFQFMQSAKTDEFGNADFDFSHASDYVIVLTDKAMNAEDATAANEKIIDKKVSDNTSADKSTETTDTSAAKSTKTTNKSAAKSTKTTLKSPKTGEF